MRILYHHRTQGRGAEGLHIAKIISALQKQGHKVIILSPPGIDPLADQAARPLDKGCEKTKGIKTLWKIISRHTPQILFEMLEVAYNLYATFVIWREAKQDDIDFIYERNAYFLFAGALMAKYLEVPLIIEANEVVGIRRARPLVLKGVAKKIEAYTFKTALAIFTVSSYLRDKIKKDVLGNKGGRIYVTPNAIDPQEFKRPTRRDLVRDKYHISDKVVLGFAGWFDWWDRLDLLVRALKKLVTKGNKNVCALLIGDGHQVSEIKALAARLGIEDKVLWTGPVNRKKIIDYLDAIDVGVISHSNEFGSPVVLFEMMAMGKIVIAPDIGPIKDVVKDGVNGLLFTPLDVLSLTDSIEKVLTNLDKMEKIGKRARKIVFQQYTWDNNAKRILDVVSH